MHTHFAAVTAENKSKFSIEHFCFCSREKYFNCIHDSTEKKNCQDEQKGIDENSTVSLALNEFYRTSM